MTLSKRMPPFFVSLLHFPMKTRDGRETVTSVTHLDIHDLARLCCTYGASQYYVVTPVSHQRALVEKILQHWLKPSVEKEHVDRAYALKRVKVVESFEKAKEDAQKIAQAPIQVVLTTAQKRKVSSIYSFKQIKTISKKKPLFLVFGTGWGIASSFFPHVDLFLEPIYGFQGETGYNHLSVRSAVSIVLDRLFS